MVLTYEQLRALATLRKRADEIRAAEDAYDELEGLCYSMSISLRQIALMGRTTHTSILRRQRRRMAAAQDTIACSGS